MLNKLFYFITYHLLRYRYDVVVQNVSRSFPDMPYAEVRNTVQEFYRHFSRLLAEILKLFMTNKKDMLKKLEMSNPELLTPYYDQNRDIIAVLGHYGNWEYVNIMPELLPFKINAIYKPLSAKIANKILFQVRAKFGMNLIPAGQALRQLLKPREVPQLSIFASDQYPGQQAPYTFEFMNQRTAVFNGAEKLAKATNAVVVYIEMSRQPANCWALHFSLITDRPRETEDQEIMRCFTEKLEKTICKEPAYWLWSHKRWK